jgi:hypothetical protein
MESTVEELNFLEDVALNALGGYSFSWLNIREAVVPFSGDYQLSLPKLFLPTCVACKPLCVWADFSPPGVTIY